MSDESMQEPFESLKEELERCMLVELLDANQFVSKETVLLRVVRKLCGSMSIPWSSLLDSTKNTYYIDQDLQNLIMQCWNHRNLSNSVVGNNSNSFASLSDDQAVIERILSRDYVRSVDLVKLASVLTKRCSPELVSQIFAVDGFVGKEPKRYVELFKYPEDDYRGRHVRFVRIAYQSVPKTERIFAVIKVALDSFQNGTLIEKYLTGYEPEDDKSYNGLEIVYSSDEENLTVRDDGKRLLTTTLKDSIEMELLRNYVDSVGYHNLELIAEWKKKQLNVDADSSTSGSKKPASKRKRSSTSTGKVKNLKKVTFEQPEVSVIEEKNKTVSKMESIEEDEYLSTSSDSDDN